MCLTEQKECCRQTAVKYRRYIDMLTLHPKKTNQMEGEKTVVDELNARRKTLFSPRNGETA